jgi:hypothetical protein
MHLSRNWLMDIVFASRTKVDRMENWLGWSMLVDLDRTTGMGVRS